MRQACIGPDNFGAIHRANMAQKAAGHLHRTFRARPETLERKTDEDPACGRAKSFF
jgi:hypothetical protein